MALYISAAHKSSGKTSITIGLAASLAARGHCVQTFKRGPDYIDPLWLARASGRACYNLDFFTQTRDEIETTYTGNLPGADVALIEGNKGLYDGMDVEGSDSNAALAKLLRQRVLLVLDCQGMTRGIAPLLQGYKAFDPEVHIAGVILNKVGGQRHEDKLRTAMERYTDIPVLGAVGNDPTPHIAERHLGLVPANEDGGAGARIQALGDAVAASVDLDRVQALAAVSVGAGAPINYPAPDVRIGVARDAAFGFYYADDLDAFRRHGAELIFFDCLKDKDVPHVDGLFIGGGFPETHMAALAANSDLRGAIKTQIENGLPTYAECGGLMYLSRSISWQGEKAAMVGVIAGDSVMHDRPRGRGYMRLEETTNGPWGRVSDDVFPAHEFHYASLDGLVAPMNTAFHVRRGTGLDGSHDGLVQGNLVAGFAHMRHTAATPWVGRFVDFVRSKKQP